MRLYKGPLSILTALLFLPAVSSAFDPGGAGALGDFAPAADTVIVLPSDGVLDYTSFTIPDGVRVTFQPNAANTPVTIRVRGTAEIRGTLDLDGSPAEPGAAGFESLGGRGGPGGSAGGSVRTGASLSGGGLSGHGPSGAAGLFQCAAGGGGSVRSAGGNGGSCFCGGAGGQADPGASVALHGGSGGGASDTHGGGGGGGALTLSASTLIIEGLISAAGASGTGRSGGGGGGSIRLVAPTITGQGLVFAPGSAGIGCKTGGGGGSGLVRFESDLVDVALLFGAIPRAEEAPAVDPTPWGPVLPTVTIARVGTVTPAPATGHPDTRSAVDVASGATITVTLTGVGIAPGTLARVAIAKAGGQRTVVDSGPFTSEAGVLTATAQIPVPKGPGAATLEAWILSLPGAPPPE